MVGTVRAARHDGRRAFALTATAFGVGLALGAALVFGGLGLLGALAHTRALIVVAVVIAAAAVASDAAGLRVRPQIRFQVPERWRRTMPLPRALFLYGLLLGTGLTTFVPASAAWALPALSLALGNVTGSLAIALGFAAGRALPVLVLAVRGEETVLAERPHGLRVLRVLTAGVAAPGARGRRGARGDHRRLDPAATRAPRPPISPGSARAWAASSPATASSRRSPAAIRRSAARSSPGTWAQPSPLRRATRWRRCSSRRCRASRSSPSPTAGSSGAPAARSGFCRSATRLAARASVEARRVAELGRPALDGDLVVYHRASAAGSWLSAVDVATGKRRRLRFARDALLLNPSLLGARLLYVRASRCSQELRLGPLGGGKERVLYRLPPLAGQDRGHERNHTNQGERLPCPHRPKPTTRMLWTTALSATTAYVTVLRPVRGGRTTPTLLAIPR